MYRRRAALGTGRCGSAGAAVPGRGGEQRGRGCEGAEGEGEGAMLVR